MIEINYKTNPKPAIKRIAINLCRDLVISKEESSLTFLIGNGTELNNLDAIVNWIIQKKITIPLSNEKYIKLSKELKKTVIENQFQV